MLSCRNFTGRRNIPPPIPGNELPRCKLRGCGGLLRPNVVWFGEDIPKEALEKASLSPFLGISIFLRKINP